MKRPRRFVSILLVSLVAVAGAIAILHPLSPITAARQYGKASSEAGAFRKRCLADPRFTNVWASAGWTEESDLLASGKQALRERNMHIGICGHVQDATAQEDLRRIADSHGFTFSTFFAVDISTNKQDSSNKPGGR